MTTLAQIILAQSQVGPTPSVAIMGVDLTLVLGMMLMTMLVVRVHGVSNWPLVRHG